MWIIESWRVWGAGQLLETKKKDWIISSDWLEEKWENRRAWQLEVNDICWRESRKERVLLGSIHRRTGPVGFRIQSLYVHPIYLAEDVHAQVNRTQRWTTPLNLLPSSMKSYFGNLPMPYIWLAYVIIGYWHTRPH